MINFNRTYTISGKCQSTNFALTALKKRYPYNIEDWLKDIRIGPLKILWDLCKKIGKIV